MKVMEPWNKEIVTLFEVLIPNRENCNEREMDLEEFGCWNVCEDKSKTVCEEMFNMS